MHKLVQAAKENMQIGSYTSEQPWEIPFKASRVDLLKTFSTLKGSISGLLSAYNREIKPKISFEQIGSGVLGYTDKKKIALSAAVIDEIKPHHVMKVFSAIALHEFFHILYTDFNSPYFLAGVGGVPNTIWQFVEDTRIECVGKPKSFLCDEVFYCIIENLLTKSMTDTFAIKAGDATVNAAIKIICKWVRFPQLLKEEDRQFEVSPGVNLLLELEKAIPNVSPSDPQFSTDTVTKEILILLEKYGLPKQDILPVQNKPKNTRAKDPPIDTTQHTAKRDQKQVKSKKEDIADVAMKKFDQDALSDLVLLPIKPEDKKSKELKQLISVLDKINTDFIDVMGMGPALSNLSEFSAGPSEIKWWSKPPKVTRTGKDDYLRIKCDLGNAVKTLSSKFLIRHSKVRSSIREQNRGQLDTTRLYRASFDSHIFKTIEETQSNGLDIGVLLDNSGSMATFNRLQNCKKVGILLAEALKSTPGVNLSIYSHRATHNLDYDGVCEIIPLYKKGITQSSESIVTMEALGGTYDGFALTAVGARMLHENTQSEKWLIYVSDGEPCAQGYIGEDAEDHVKKVVKHLQQRGMHIIGVDIGNQKAFAKMFPTSVKFKDTNHLVGSFGKLITSLLRNRTKEVRVE